MDVVEMYPLDFEEFALANRVAPSVIESLREMFAEKTPAPDAVHGKLMDLFRLYLIVGGIHFKFER